ncbi:hypothetical protein GUJ93_ZPchr0008g13362 [Zizania palustris]|uniref:Uncharacterized protein n=1 Tax=Zizania palustris TaxID=103762 RepID=A0A8J5RGN1_ZIZPA|nr:hypothetical protein GUJ93_ZPchr0008g13362 [Zizania palustris]
MAGDALPVPGIPTRCHHCAGPLSKDMETSSWTVPPLVRDSFSMIGSAIGGTAGAFYGFNYIGPSLATPVVHEVPVIQEPVVLDVANEEQEEQPHVLENNVLVEEDIIENDVPIQEDIRDGDILV